MQHATETQLSSFSVTVRVNIVTNVGRGRLRKLSRTRLRTLKKFAMQNIRRAVSASPIDRTSASEFDDIDLSNMGAIRCGLEESDIDKLSRKAIEKYMGELSQCAWSRTQRKRLVQRAKGVVSNLLTSLDGLMNLGSLVSELDASDYSSISSSYFEGAMKTISTAIASRDQLLRQRLAQGHRDDISDTELTEERSARGSFLATMMRNVLANSAGRRRKRSVTTYTCSQVTALGSSAPSAMSASDITAMGNSEYSTCLSKFGEVTGWSTDQLIAHVAKLQAVYGSTLSAWSSTVLQDMGSLAGGLSTTQIGELTLTSIDAMYSMGKHNVFSSAQLQAFFGEWLKDAKGSTMSSVTASELSSLSNFDCGMTTSQISSLSNSAFSSAATTLGSLTSCSSTQWSGFITKAKTSFGSSVPSWSTSVVSNLGYIVGGLTSSEMGSLTTDQLAVLSTSVIAQIPTTTIVGLSTGQIGAFSSNQARAVSYTQQMALSTTQLQALVNAGATDLTGRLSSSSSSGSGATGTDTSGTSGGSTGGSSSGTGNGCDSGKPAFAVTVLLFGLTMVIRI